MKKYLILLLSSICIIFSSCSFNKTPEYITKYNIGLCIISQDELFSNATYIVEAEVTEILDSTIESVILPLSSEACDSIVTDTNFKVTNVIKGNINSDYIIVRRNIGTVGNTTLICDQEPNFEKKEKVLLFLNDDELSDTYRLTYFIYGKYSQISQSKYVNDFSGYCIDLSNLTG